MITFNRSEPCNKNNKNHNSNSNNNNYLYKMVQYAYSRAIVSDTSNIPRKNVVDYPGLSYSTAASHK